MKRMTKIGIYGMAVWMLSACGNGTPDYDATGTFEATEVIVSAEAAGKLLQLEVEEGTRLKAGEEVGLVDTVQLYLKKLQLEASMKSVESQRPDLAKQIAATKQQITTAQREKKRVENLLAAGAANQKQLDDWDAQVTLLQRQLIAQESSLMKSTNSLTEQGNSVSVQVAQENGTQGRVIVQFVVNKDGSIVDAKVVRSVDPYLDKEALRVINTMPKWKPGMQRGKPVRVKFTVPVMFRLQ